MEELFQGILFEMGGCEEGGTLSDCSYLRFALISMFYGFLVVLVDFISLKLFKTSYLSIKYIQNVIVVFLFYTIGSFIVGYIGGATNLINTGSSLSPLVVGVSWQLIFARWAKQKFKDEDVQPEE